MAITTEDGTSVAGANSYGTVSGLDDYAVHRIDSTLYATYSNADKESALVQASDTWIDGYHQFRSEPADEDQGLFFPSLEDGLPTAIVEACYKAALLQLQGLLLVDLSAINVSGEVQSESKSVGPLSKSTTYRSGTAARHSRVLPADLTGLLRPYLLTGGPGAVIRL